MSELIAKLRELAAPLVDGVKAIGHDVSNDVHEMIARIAANIPEAEHAVAAAAVDAVAKYVPAAAPLVTEVTGDGTGTALPPATDGEQDAPGTGEPSTPVELPATVSAETAPVA